MGGKTGPGELPFYQSTCSTGDFGFGRAPPKSTELPTKNPSFQWQNCGLSMYSLKLTAKHPWKLMVGRCFFPFGGLKGLFSGAFPVNFRESNYLIHVLSWLIWLFGKIQNQTGWGNLFEGRSLYKRSYRTCRINHPMTCKWLITMSMVSKHPW